MVHDGRPGLERRIWRLAFLLSGDREGAAALVDRILDAQAKPEALEPARLDRLVIQQARGLLLPLHERSRPLVASPSSPARPGSSRGSTASMSYG
jgi:hypothetical protein